MKVSKKFVKLGTGADEINARDLPANYTATNYTPDEVSSEGDDKVSAHLKGIDTQLGTVSSPFDIGEGTDSITYNSTEDVAGLLFDGTTGGFKCIIRCDRGGIAEIFELIGVKSGSTWYIDEGNSIGQDTLVSFSITNTGQVRCTVDNTYAFNVDLRYRAWGLGGG